MKKNVGGMDKNLRIVLGVILLSLLFVLEGNIRFIGLIGIVMLGTGLMGVCPAYLPFGISTCKTEKPN